MGINLPCFIDCEGAHFQVCRFCGLVCGTCKVFKIRTKVVLKLSLVIKDAVTRLHRSYGLPGDANNWELHPAIYKKTMKTMRNRPILKWTALSKVVSRYCSLRSCLKTLQYNSGEFIQMSVGSGG